MGPSTGPVSRGRTLVPDDQGKKKALASASHGMSARSASHTILVDGRSQCEARRSHTFLGNANTKLCDECLFCDASTLHDVPVRTLTIKLFYGTMVSGAGDMCEPFRLPTSTV